MADEPIQLGYADPTLGKLVIIARFSDEFQARLAGVKLEAEGVDTLVGDRSNIVGIGARGATLAVATEDVDEAIEILKQTPAKGFLIEPKPL